MYDHTDPEFYTDEDELISGDEEIDSSDLHCRCISCTLLWFGEVEDDGLARDEIVDEYNDVEGLDCFAD